ncbi:MAG: hypothetical protein AAFN00_05165 [Cyanobacteria bacterium J06558_2]
MNLIQGGLWFKKHCLEITPRTKTNGVRYRYSGEDWVTVLGADDYTVEDNADAQGQCAGSAYTVRGTTPWYFFYNDQLIGNTSVSVWTGQIKRIINPSNPWILDRPFSGANKGYHQRACVKVVDMSGEIRLICDYPGDGVRGIREAPSNTTIQRRHPVNRRPDNRPDNCGSCVLTIYQQEQEVYQESRKVCPEVEILEADECKEVPVSKRAKLETTTTPLGFITSARQEVNSEGIPVAAIPDECINLYRVDVIQEIINRGNLPFPGYTLLGQYCSDPGCPPPTVKRLGDKCGRECAPGLCPVLCSGVVCCYDGSTGVALDQIPIDQYKGDI